MSLSDLTKHALRLRLAAWRSRWLIEGMCIAQIATAAVLLLWKKPPRVAGVIAHTLGWLPFSILLLFVMGVGLRMGWERVRGRFSSYWGVVRSREWLVLSARLLVLNLVVALVYSLLKLFIPLINPASFDQRLWDLDRLLLGGRSPNIFFLELFRQPALFRAIDFIYGHIFFCFLLIQPLFLAVPSSEKRTRFFLGNALLWFSGACLYLLIPSIGPIYRFPEVFAGTDEFFPGSRAFQTLLMSNYSAVIGLASGLAPATPVSGSYGIAAFPSLHVAYESYVAMWVSGTSRPVGAALWFLTAVTLFGSVITGWHYWIDSIAGLLLGWLCFVSTRAHGEPVPDEL